MASNWEDTFRRWSGPASDTEDDKRGRTERAIREAIDDSSELTGLQIRTFAKGSYKNNTNVRLDSDVDVAVELQEIIYYRLTNDLEGMSGAEFGMRYAQKMWIEDFPENAVYLPHKQLEKAGAPTSAGRIHRYGKTTAGRAGP